MPGAFSVQANRFAAYARRTTFFCLRLIAAAGLASAASVPTLAQTAGLPGGASSLNETFRDWTVSCILQTTTKRCVFSQVQKQQNGQRVLAIEMNAPVDRTVTGKLVLPFGLALASGAAFQIDDKPAMQAVQFRTCLPAGCFIDFTFDAATLAVLKTGAVLKVNTMADGGATMPFSISLQGFGTALDRVATLAQ